MDRSRSRSAASIDGRLTAVCAEPPFDGFHQRNASCNESIGDLGRSVNVGTATAALKRFARATIHQMNLPKTKSPLPKLMFTVHETATMLSISEKTVYRLIQRGELKAPKAVRTKRITAASIEVFAGLTH